MTTSTTEAEADPNTGAGLIEFLDAAIDKGWFNVSTAKALRTASTKILSVENGWETVDLRTLDVDHLYERFQNLKRNDYSDDSMRIYRTRFTQALKMHLGRLDNDPAWKTYGPAAKGNAPKPTNGSTKVRAPKSSNASTIASADTSPPTGPGGEVAPESTSLMRFPFPLRENLDVSLSLPRDLTKDEAARLSAFISTLAREVLP